MQLAGVLQRCGAVPSESCSCHADRKALFRSGLKLGPRYAPPVVHEVLARAGAPLEARVRLPMESRFHRDFTMVRVHADSSAAESAAAVDARAYTVGQHIVFGAGNYPPVTAGTQHLLAHELTHVLQQQTRVSPRAQLSVAAPDTPLEQEAERNADSIGFPESSPPSYASPRAAGFLQRQALTDSEIDEVTEDVPEPDLAVQDGSSPVAALEPIGEVPDDELSSDPSYLAEEVGELGSVFLARSPGGKKKPAPTKAPSKPKPRLITKIDVDLGAQVMTLTWSDGASETHVVSTGIGCPNTSANPCPTGKEAYCTPTGDFTAGDKGDESKTNSHGDKMAWWVRVVGGIGIHNSQKADGTPRSHGCIRIGEGAADEAFAKKINEHVTGKTKVHISGTAPTKPWHMSKKNMKKFHFDGCPAPAPPKPAPTPAKRTPPGRVRRP